MSYGGGAFLLTLSVFAGVCLITLPAKTETANAADNTITSLTENNTIQWKVVELSGTDAQMQAQVSAIADDEPYVKYVMRNHWSNSRIVSPRGKNVIWDLNGYTLKPSGEMVAMNLSRNISNFELIDSSASGAGRVESYGTGWRGYGLLYALCQNFIVSGGTLAGFVEGPANYIIRGGNLESTHWLYSFFYPVVNQDKILLADYVKREDGMVSSGQTIINYRTKTNTNNASYAVYGSTNDFVSGAYNYEFSSITENLVAGHSILAQLTNPNQPNYLLYRSSPTAAYQVIATL